MASTKLVLFNIEQSPPQYKTLLGGNIAQQNGLIALHSESFVDLLSLNKKCFVRADTNAFAVSTSTSHSGAINSLSWNESDTSTGGAKAGIISLALSHVTGNLSIYQIQGTQSICTTELHRLTLKSLLKELCRIDLAVSKTQVLSFSSDKLTVLVDRQLVVRLCVNETKPWHIIHTIECPQKILHGSVTNNTLVLVDSDHSVLLYNVTNKDFLAVVRREKGKCWNSCRLSADYLQLTLQNDDGELYCCNLDNYFKQNHILLNKTHGTQSRVQDSGTTHWYSSTSLPDDSRTSSQSRKFHNSKSLYKVPFVGDCLSYQSAGEYISAICHSKGVMLLVSYCITTGQTEKLQITSDEYIVLSDTDSVPHILISDTHVYAAALGHFHKLYNQADIASGLWSAIITRNRWGGVSFVPDVKQLVTAIQNRDINAVLHHIKLYKSFVDDLMTTPAVDQRADVEKMCSLAYSTASAYSEHSSTRLFALQVSEAMLAFLKEQSRRGMSMLNEMLLTENTGNKVLMESLVDKMSDYSMSFSELIRAHARPEPAAKGKTKGSKGKSSEQSSPGLNEDIIAKWNLLSSKELIGDGILMGDIALLQSYFKQKNRQAEASWDFIVTTGLQCTLEELEAKNWTSACQMLKNMGFGVFSKLSQMANYTTDHRLREYVMQQLQIEKTFTEDEQEMITFSGDIERLYPCQSFKEAIAVKQRANLNRLPNSDVFSVAKFCGEIGVVSPETESSQWYSHYMLDWLDHWKPHRDDIYIDRYIQDKESVKELDNIPVAVIWSYLCRHNRMDMILDWISVMYAGKAAVRGFQKQPITMEMVDECCTALPLLNRTKLLDQLTLHGVLSSSVSLSVQRKFVTLARAGMLLDRQRSDKLISIEEIVCHCVEHGLLELLFQCFSSWQISAVEIKNLESSIPGKTFLLLDMFYSFYKLTVHGPDPSRMLEASLNSSRYLSKNPYLSHVEQLGKQLTDVTLCDLLYHNPILEGSEQSLNPEQVAAYKEHRLVKYLFEGIEESTSPAMPDISIYSLIQKWGTLNGDRLFAVQMKPEDSTQPASEETCEMYHFSNRQISARYGVEVKLTFLHYLKQARPCFAFLTFLTNESSINSGSAIPTSRMKLAVKQAHYLAVKHYTELEVGASCITFLELMNEKTQRLRLLINAAQVIHAAKLQKNSSADPKLVHSEVESLLLPAVFSLKYSIKEAYEQLVESADQVISGSSVEAGLKWKPIIDFSRLYNLPPPTRFLEQCASGNNWLSFLVYSQVFNYDLSNLSHIVCAFSADGIREHLQCVLDSAKQCEADNSPVVDGQERAEQLQDRMIPTTGRRPREVTVLVSSSDDERKNKNRGLIPALPDIVSTPASNGNSLPIEQLPNDIFAVLFLTNNKPDSWRQLNSYAVQLENPVLSVLAACQRRSSSLECLSCWLFASLSATSPLASEFKNPQPGKVVLKKTIVGAINHCIDNYRLQLLKTGLQIFAPHCPLLPLLDAVGEMPGQRFFVVSSLFAKYKTLMKKMSHQETARGDELTFQELVTLSLRAIQCCVDSFDSVLCERLLHLLDETNLLSIFKDQHVNFGYVYKVYWVVYERRLPGISCSRLVSPHCMDEIKHVLKILEARKEFGAARTLAAACDLDPGLVSVAELNSDAELAKLGSDWKKDGGNEVFWSRCHDKCVEHDLSPDKCAAFFEAQASMVAASLQDKIQLSQLAYNWMRQIAGAFESNGLDRLQKLIWQSKIDLILQESSVTDYPQLMPSTIARRPKATISIDKTQFLQIEQRHEKLLELLQASKQTPTPNTAALSRLIGQLLDDFRIEEACLVSEEYGFTTRDVVVIQVCLGLAMKRLDPEHLDSGVTALLRGSTAGRQRSSSSSQGYLLSIASVDGSSPMAPLDPASAEKDERMMMLAKIAEKCNHGAKACDKIVCCYGISMALGLSYRDTVLQSEYSLLKQLLSSQVSERYQLALEYIDTCALSDSDIACFLSGHIYNTLQLITGLQGSANHDMAAEQLMVAVEDCMSTGKDCKQLIQLFTDQTVFGQSLLEQAAAIIIDEPNVKLKLAVKVEMLILSHEAYSCAYDMEGISAVLRACRTCTVQMNEVSYYTLMVHMLIGIGRYSEMTYIFEALKQNHQFELLFRKGRSKDNKLKLAVLDFLRRFCPGDNDIYRIVSSHFAMYREIAELLEHTAISKLGAITSISSKNQDQLSTTLSDIQRNLTDAAEIYIEGKCLQHAQVCVRLARLVYLQISLVSTSVQVVNLEPNQVKSFIEHHDKFSHAFAVSEAYNKNYWAAALCNNVLVKGDNKYLNDFKRSFTLTPPLITEIVQRFQLRSDVVQTSHTDSTLRRLLTHCRDVVVKYKLAQSLGLTDITKELLTADNGVLGAVIRDSNLSLPKQKR